MSKRILFVDDEPMVLQGIQRSLRIMRPEWDMEFSTSGPEALEIMARGHFDVVISDMRMPGMSGAQLLEQVKAKYPRTVRMILSGQSDRETILRSIGPTHQYLSKPCSVEELRRKLARAFTLRDLLDNPKLKDIVSRIQTVPSLPSLYVEITQALQSPGTSVAELGSIIERDMGMASKVLQLVNSAFFGLPCRVAGPKQAVALIGIDNIRALVLSVHVFSQLEHQLTNDLAFLWKHGCATAAFARLVSQSQDSSRHLADDAFTAGLLHDIGRLVLASACTAEYAQVLRTASDTKTAILACEREVFSCTHAEVGAYLLGLWGLPDAIVEAVAWHHEPSKAQQAGFSPLIAVHAADHCDHLMHSYPNQNHVPNLDENLLAEMGLKDRLTVWLQACQELDRKGEDHA